MNTNQTIISSPFIQDLSSPESSVNTSEVLKNLIIEKRASNSWLYGVYKNSIFGDLWSLFSSPVS